MKSTLLLMCCVISLFFSLNGGDQNVPEWLEKLKQENTSLEKRESSDKWCVMFKHLPKNVQEKLTEQLTQKEIEYRLSGFPLYKRTIYKYAIYTASLNKMNIISSMLGFGLIKRLFRKHYLREAIAQLVKNNQTQQFSDEHQEQSFKIMLHVLQKEVAAGLYPGWNVERCAECCLGVVKERTIY